MSTNEHSSPSQRTAGSDPWPSGSLAAKFVGARPMVAAGVPSPANERAKTPTAHRFRPSLPGRLRMKLLHGPRPRATVRRSRVRQVQSPDAVNPFRWKARRLSGMPLPARHPRHLSPRHRPSSRTQAMTTHRDTQCLREVKLKSLQLSWTPRYQRSSASLTGTACRAAIAAPPWPSEASRRRHPQRRSLTASNRLTSRPPVNLTATQMIAHLPLGGDGE